MGTAKQSRKRNRELRVTLFNVGQGDHILLELPNGEFGIIDFHYDSPLIEPPVLTYFEHLNSTGHRPVIAFICISHPDKDHIKGIDYFLTWALNNNITIREFWSFAGNDFSEFIEDYREAYDAAKKTDQMFHNISAASKCLRMIRDFTKSKKCHTEYLQDIRPINSKLGGEIAVTSLAPLGTDVQRFNRQVRKAFFKLILDEKSKAAAQRNLVSSVLAMKFKKHTLIFGGDTGKKIWHESLKRLSEDSATYGSFRGSFIKISHHGSKYSSSETIWSQILAEKSVIGISAGRTALHHPHHETLADISKISSQNKWQTQVFSTNECGACLNQRNAASTEAKWFKNWKPTLSGQEQEGLRLMSSSRYPRGQPPRHFLGYVFVFRPNSEDITINRLISGADNCATSCIYGGTRRQLFPKCGAVSS